MIGRGLLRLLSCLSIEFGTQAKRSRTEDPKYCQKHRYVQHPLENCWTFTNLLETEYRAGRIPIKKAAQKEKTTWNSVGIHKDSVGDIAHYTAIW